MQSEDRDESGGSAEQGDLHETIVRPRHPVRDAVPHWHADDDTIIRLVEPPSPPGPLEPRTVSVPTVVARVIDSGQDVRDSTIDAGTERAAVDSGPSADVPATPPAALPIVSWAFRVRGTEVVVPLDVPAHIGRRPGASRVPAATAPRRVVIPSQHRDVSSQHARIEQLGASIVVTDLGSTNGIVVHWSAGGFHRLRPGASSVVLADAIVELGDGVEIEFLAASPAVLHPGESLP